MTDANNPVNPDRTFIEPKIFQLGPSPPSSNERLPIGSGVIAKNSAKVAWARCLKLAGQPKDGWNKKAVERLSEL